MMASSDGIGSITILKSEEELNINYLLTKLEERYPNKFPLQELSMFELGRGVGQQDVIYYIKELFQIKDI